VSQNKVSLNLSITNAHEKIAGTQLIEADFDRISSPRELEMASEAMKIFTRKLISKEVTFRENGTEPKDLTLAELELLIQRIKKEKLTLVASCFQDLDKNSTILVIELPS
jgi:hypothetical protein